jgi:ABC-type transport system involved in Fe-S cluster assembly fused permease/ATPase subunit
MSKEDRVFTHPHKLSLWHELLKRSSNIRYDLDRGKDKKATVLRA